MGLGRRTDLTCIPGPNRNRGPFSSDRTSRSTIASRAATMGKC